MSKFVLINILKMKKEIENPKPDEKVCFNCKHILWMVALGQGVKCALDKKDIPSRFHTCNNFDPKTTSN